MFGGIISSTTEGQELVFRQRAPFAIFGMGLFLFMAIAPLFLLGGGEPIKTVIMGFLLCWGVSLGPLLMSAPEELRINVEQRTYRYHKGWIWQHPYTGLLGDLAGVCTTRKDVLLVLKKHGVKKRWFDGSTLRVTSLNDPGTIRAEELAALLSLPVVPRPW